MFQLKQHLKMDGRNTGFFWDGICSGAMLVSGRVSIPMYSLKDWMCAIVNSVFLLTGPDPQKTHIKSYCQCLKLILREGQDHKDMILILI